MSKVCFWSTSYFISVVLSVGEFWTFVVLRETHVIRRSWWWLVAFQVSSFLSMLNAYGKIRSTVH